MPIKQINTYAILRRAGIRTIDTRIDMLNKQKNTLYKKMSEIEHCIYFLDSKLDHYYNIKNIKGFKN
ncbi:MerR family transcriptional regulator [Apilactobacillus micheneri]|nr:hypothetical protein [Apilactobacillus micheneri]